MSIPLFESRYGVVTDRHRFELHRFLTHLAVFVAIATGVAMYLLAPTKRRKP